MTPSNDKPCSSCGVTDEVLFGRTNRYGKNDRKTICKACSADYQRTWRAKNSESVKRKGRELHLKTKYGLLQEDFDGMLWLQDNKCAICERPDPNQVDHDHATGKVRGILCGPCNRAIGLLGDNCKTVQSAADYLSVVAHTQTQ